MECLKLETQGKVRLKKVLNAKLDVVKAKKPDGIRK